ncbi:hypothetical protein JCM8097_004400 [Rhodosporidiobolus ruineniae]
MTALVPNNAAWLVEKGAPLEVGPAPVGTPGEAEVLIKVHAVAIEPVDNMVQATGFMVCEWPFLLGQSLAGEVVEVGSAVQNVKKGDRVLGHSVALVTQVSTQAAFQNYALLPALSVAPIPSSLTFERATVLPLALSTAANGLYRDTFLGLPLPKAESPNKEGKGKVVLVWGGSSSVGSAAIQLATASGVRVVTTASPANFSFVKSLGASSVFDYRSPPVVEDLVAELQKDGEDFAGVFDAVSAGGSVELSAEVASKVEGGKKFVATTLPFAAPEKLAEGVKTDQVKAILTILDKAGTLAKSIYHDYVPSALANGSLQAKPDPVVVEGMGLEAIQKGLERQREGVSAQKVVVTVA